MAFGETTVLSSHIAEGVCTDKRGYEQTSAVHQTAAVHQAPSGWRAQARFRAIKLLGRGAEADTWLFADRRRDHAIAMKLFTRPVAKHLVPSILREIRLQSELGPGHMNLINVYEVLLTDDHLGIAMVGALLQSSGNVRHCQSHMQGMG